MQSELKEKQILDTAVLAGQIMLQSGAEIARVEDTIRRILKTTGWKRAEAFVTSTGFVVTLDDPRYDSMTVVRRITNRETNLNRIALTNEISRKLCDGLISVEEAYASLKYMPKTQYSSLVKNIMIILIAVNFAPILGGGFWECIFSGLIAVGHVCVIWIGNRLSFTPFLKTMTQSMEIAIGAILCVYFSKEAVSLEIITASCLMVLVPGAALTTAFRDTLQGDYLAGMSKMMEAFVQAISICVGVGVMMLLGGGLL